MPLVARPRESRRLGRREPGAQPRRERRGRGDDDVVVLVDLAVGARDLDPPVDRLDARDRRRQLDLHPFGAQELAEALEHARVTAGHVAEHLFLQPRAPRGVEPLDRRPQEGGRRLGVRVAELGPQLRQPEPPERAPPESWRNHVSTSICSSLRQSVTREPYQIVAPSRSLSIRLSAGGAGTRARSTPTRADPRCSSRCASSPTRSPRRARARRGCRACASRRAA